MCSGGGCVQRSGGWYAVAVLVLLLGLSACNTTDALTPQVDIGGGMERSSSPVTQDDTDRMAGTYKPAPFRSAPPTSRTYSRGPNNTLESQARALENGETISPSSSGPPPEWEGQTSSSLAQMPSTGGAPVASPTNQAALPSAQADGGGTIRFLPIIGAPFEAVTPLSRQLAAAARSSGLTIRPSVDAST